MYSRKIFEYIQIFFMRTLYISSMSIFSTFILILGGCTQTQEEVSKNLQTSIVSLHTAAEDITKNTQKKHIKKTNINTDIAIQNIIKQWQKSWDEGNYKIFVDTFVTTSENERKFWHTKESIFQIQYKKIKARTYTISFHYASGNDRLRLITAEAHLHPQTGKIQSWRQI